MFSGEDFCSHGRHVDAPCAACNAAQAAAQAAAKAAQAAHRAQFERKTIRRKGKS